MRVIEALTIAAFLGLILMAVLISVAVMVFHRAGEEDQGSISGGGDDAG